MALADAVEAGTVPARIVLVVSDQPAAAGLERARERGVPVLSLPWQGEKREDYDRLVVAGLREAGAEIICLAGFMRLLSPWFVRSFPGRILNIHPSLLPAFPGLHAQRQALEWGAKISGCTVHFVDEKLDHGPIIVQRGVPVLEDDDEGSLSARILREEHRAFPEALRLVCLNRVSLHGRRVRVLPES